MEADGRDEPRRGGELADGPLPNVPSQREDASVPETAPAEVGRSDADLIVSMRDGDLDAFGELYRRHAGAVRRYARTCCRDVRGAEDLTDVVFLRTLQAVRGGTGPDSAIRIHLLTMLRRVAAAWASTTKRDLLVEDYAVFAGSAERTRDAHEDAFIPDPDVRAMRGAEQSLAVRAFRSLPEPWQTVLWHITVEKERADQVAPLLGLSPKATGVLTQRACEGFTQAYLQAHVNSSRLAGGDCTRYAARLGVFARGALRGLAARGLREHVARCPKCRTAALGARDVDARLRALLPVAILGWSATGYATEATDLGAAAGAPGTSPWMAGRAGTTVPAGAVVPAPREDGTGGAPGAHGDDCHAASSGGDQSEGEGEGEGEGDAGTAKASVTGSATPTSGAADVGRSGAEVGATNADMADPTIAEADPVASWEDSTSPSEGAVDSRTAEGTSESTDHGDESTEPPGWFGFPARATSHAGSHAEPAAGPAER
ncbi:sigma factor, partial [Streptomyces sp. NPDC051776]|uniref:sigma factor n=1 Tax=Streptomyces sp. NPDC051776 TaxID=3155414 RepID=UPI003444C3B7